MKAKVVWGVVEDFHGMTAIGMLEDGMTVDDVAVSFDVHRTTILRLAQRFSTTDRVKDMSRSGRPKRLTSREERYIRITAVRDRHLPATRIVDRVRGSTGVYPRKQSAKILKVFVLNQEDHIKVWRYCPPHSDTHGKISTCAEIRVQYFFRMNLDSHLSLQMVAFVSRDGLMYALRRPVLCQLTAFVAIV